MDRGKAETSSKGAGLRPSPFYYVAGIVTVLVYSLATPLGRDTSETVLKGRRAARADVKCLEDDGVRSLMSPPRTLSPHALRTRASGV